MLLQLNLGSAQHIKEGFVNCDARAVEGVNKVFDLTDKTWPFGDDSVTYICTEECIEHLPYWSIENFFKECYRILKHGGQLYIQCPDIGAMCEMYAKGQVCDCVPRKVKKFEDFKPKKDCEKCGGKALVNPDRWLFAFIGAQKHDYDFHKMIFTKESMRFYLQTYGFNDIQFRNNIYKIKVTARKL
jgi:SAM-dependent methyltransferase